MYFSEVTFYFGLLSPFPKDISFVCPFTGVRTIENRDGTTKRWSRPRYGVGLFYNIAGNFVTLITGRLITGGRINEVRLLSFELYFCKDAMYIGLKKLNNIIVRYLMAYKLCAK